MFKKNQLKIPKYIMQIIKKAEESINQSTEYIYTEYNALIHLYFTCFQISE